MWHILNLAAAMSIALPALGGSLPIPSDAQLDWADLESGQFVRLIHPADPGQLTLEKFDPYRLADCAMAQHACYLMVVVKDADGFCWWQTATTKNSVVSSKWKSGQGDLFGDLVTACRSRGIAVGFSLSPIDQSFGAGRGGVTSDPARQGQYNDYFVAQLTELCSNYGPQVEIYFEGGLYPALSERVGKLVKQSQPNACLFNGPFNTIRAVVPANSNLPAVVWNAISKPARDKMLAGNGLPDSRDGDPAGVYWAPIEFHIALSDRPDGTPKSLDLLLKSYLDAVGNGTQFLLEVSPAVDGSIADADFHRIAELGNAIQSGIGFPLVIAHGQGPSVSLDLKQPAEIDHLIIQEEITSGQRIQRYFVEALIGDQWKRIADGESIGHKKIHTLQPITAAQFRLTIARSAGVPQIRRFYATRTGFNPRVPDTLPTLAALEEPNGPTNLAFVGNGAKPAIASSAYPLEKHQAKGLNDGQYGNEHSWIPNAPDAWFQIELAKIETIGRLKLGRDREGKFSDRAIREMRIDVSSDGQSWHPALPKTDLSTVPDYSPTSTMQIQIAPVEARYVKVWVNPAECCIDEFEIYAPYPRPAGKLPDIRMLAAEN